MRPKADKNLVEGHKQDEVVSSGKSQDEESKKMKGPNSNDKKHLQRMKQFKDEVIKNNIVDVFASQEE